MRILAAALLAVLLVGCGGEDAPSGHEADVAFAQEMIPHHADALVMVDMVAGHDVSAEFAALTEQIRAAQTPEIEEMVTWLAEWREEVPETSRDHMNADHGGGHGNGHGSDEMSELANAGAGFEDMWLEMMIDHHEGAIEMAEAEIENGEDERAIRLARSIVSSQQAEIETMESMLER